MNNLNKQYMNLPDMAVEVTPQLEERIKNANREAHALHLAMLPTVYVEAGLEGGSSTKYKANSFNRNFYNMLIFNLFSFGQTNNTFGEGSLSLVNIDGYIITEIYGTSFKGFNSQYDYYESSFCINIKDGSDSFGILIGSGTAAEDFNGYKLANKIMNGVNANQMTYYATSKLTANYDAVNKKWSQSYQRNFENNTTANITITETALVGYTDGYFMFERTVFPTPLVVPPGKIAAITYTFDFMYPEPASTV